MPRAVWGLVWGEKASEPVQQDVMARKVGLRRLWEDTAEAVLIGHAGRAAGC